MSTIQETIDRLRGLDQNVSPAPWEITHSRHLETMEGLGLAIEDSDGETVTEVDADFEHHTLWIDNALPLMVELRNALPVLLAEIERLTTENKKLTGAWEDGYKTAAHTYYEGPSEPEDFTQDARLHNPYKENKK